MAWLWFPSCWILALMCSGAFGLANAGSNSNTVLRATMMHRDHFESPLSVPGASAADRYRAAADREQVRMARRGLASTAAAVEFNASIGNALAEESLEYIVTLYVGTPAVQKFALLMDTGSDLVWVQCVPCIECYNATNPPFNPLASSSYSAASCNSSSCNNTLLGGTAAFCNSLNTCEIHYAYAQSGSEYEGVLSTETVAFDNATTGIPNILFGCMNNNTASFGEVDGFLGFGRGPFSLPSQLTASGSIDVFSFCLVPFIDAATLMSSLVFGAPASTNLQLTYTPILDIDPVTFYWVNMTGISINGITLNIAPSFLEYNSTLQSGGTFFDSGTTYLTFAQDIYTTVTEELKALITYPIVTSSDQTDICFNTSGVQDLVLPNMTLYFSGLDGTTTSALELANENLVIASDEEDVMCLAINAGGAPGTQTSTNIIGNVAQADHYIETDLINKRIGWVTWDCSLPM